jgi:hypothetical protein
MAADTIASRLDAIRAGIAAAEADCARQPGSVALVAVSKTFGEAAIGEALAAGQRIFGENYIQESKAKWPALKERHPDAALHFIGPLQSNKAEDAVRLFDVIESLDRESLAKELAKQTDRIGRRPRLLVQVNTGDEPQKGGVSPRGLGTFLSLCRVTYGLEIAGLMCIPPAEQPPSPHFALLAKLARDNGLATLSMGMSADYPAAIQLGATHVRVGSAIFGARG